jgi:hypothetical protein
MNKVMYDNKNNTEKINEDIKNLINGFYEKFEKLKYNNIRSSEVKIYNEGKVDDGKYVGEFKNGLRDGKGVINFNNGDKYQGEWKDDKREGKGITYYKNGE